MNRTLNIFLLLSFVSVVVNSLSFQANNEPVTLIVNPNVNNTGYTPGEQCGNSTAFSCNNIKDSINYFSTIAVPYDPTSKLWVYQLLNIQLADGLYNVDQNSVDFLEFNVTISPFNGTSSSVIFNGINSTSPLFTINSVNVSSEAQLQSSVLINGITFKNFSKPIISVTTNSSYSSIVFDGCNFYDFDSTKQTFIYSMIDINSNNTVAKTVTSSLSFRNSGIYRANSGNNTLIKTSFSNVYFNNVVGNTINAHVGTISHNGALYVTNCSFSDSTTDQGLFLSFDSSSMILNSTFQNNEADSTSAVLSYGVSQVSKHSFSVSLCSFINNTSPNGAAIYSASSTQTTETLPSIIVDCVFNGNSANLFGGAIYAFEAYLMILNTTLTKNYATTQGSAIYSQSSTIKMTDCNMTQNLLPATSIGGIVYSYYSTYTITDVSSDDVQDIFVCSSSTMYFSQQPTGFNPSNSLSCVSCTASFSDKNESICTVPTTSTSASFIYVATSTTGTTTGTTTGSATVIQISKLLILFSVLISMILIQ